MDEISVDLVAYIQKNVKTERYHLIGHSLGNIIARNTFKIGYPPGLGRIVMLAPPNQQPHLAKVFRNFWPYQWLFRDCGQKLASDEFYKNLPVPSVEFGVIAGDRGQPFTFYEPNDFIVSVESTKLNGMKEWRLLHHGHTFIMCFDDTFECCLNFLKDGTFRNAAADKVGISQPEDEARYVPASP